ncbi:hypothetical protein ACFOWU_03800 [Epilithonimonas zeae]|uniref:TonB C-terminal domain-containing protein n=1 Tax=Epilithonimonas zeae TaxID=1416779 RepID=A0A1N6ERF4_9FLAO|nr:hypothetical protein [Epilithonimonas zeae]SIN85672.1 hypothetical protein SAMN05444409_0806 [Epilithonimonas zeae]
MKSYLFLIIIFLSLNIKAQNLREEIKLKNSDFKVYDIDSNEKDSDVTKYQIIDSKGKKLEHIARIFDKKLNKETFLGIYRKNDSEIHFIEFNQTKEVPTLNHYVYIPDANGKLVLAKKEVGLKDYPADLPPKFKNNKPIHPEFVGGDAELNKWVEKNITPILKKELTTKDFVLTLEIDENGTATLQNLSLLSLKNETEKALIAKISEMPKWNTTVQGYKVTGVAYVPVSKP